MIKTCTARHNHLREAILDSAAVAGLGPVKEGRFLLPGCDRRPADVLLHNWAQGRDAALDVTVVTPMRQELVEQAATNPGHALSVKYDEKLNGVEELCRRRGMAFFPLAAETFGWWHSVGEREVKKLNHLWGRRAILLQRSDSGKQGSQLPTTTS